MKSVPPQLAEREIDIRQDLRHEMMRLQHHRRLVVFSTQRRLVVRQIRRKSLLPRRQPRVENKVLFRVVDCQVVELVVQLHIQKEDRELIEHHFQRRPRVPQALEGSRKRRIVDVVSVRDDVEIFALSPVLHQPSLYPQIQSQLPLCQYLEDWTYHQPLRLRL